MQFLIEEKEGNTKSASSAKETTKAVKPAETKPEMVEIDLENKVQTIKPDTAPVIAIGVPQQQTEHVHAVQIPQP